MAAISDQLPRARAGDPRQFDDTVRLVVGHIQGGQAVAADDVRGTVPVHVSRGRQDDFIQPVAVQVSGGDAAAGVVAPLFAAQLPNARAARRELHRSVARAVGCVRFLQLRRRNHIGSAAPSVLAFRADDHMDSAPVFELAGDSDADASSSVSGAAQKPGTQAVGNVRQFHHAVGAAVRAIQAGEVRAVDEIDGAGSLVRLARVSPVGCADRQVFPAIAVPIADGDAVARLLVGCGADKLPRVLLARHVPQADDAVRCAVGGVRLGKASAGDEVDGAGARRSADVAERGGNDVVRNPVVVEVAGGQCRPGAVALLLAADQVRGQVGLEWIPRESVPGVVHAVAVGVRVGVVAYAVAVGIRRFVAVLGKRIGVVAHAVAVGVRRFVGVFQEWVAIVAHAIAVAVHPLSGVFGKRIGVVAHAIAVAVRALRCVKRKRVVAVVHAVAVVVRVPRVADAVAIGVPPLAGILGKRVLGVDYAIRVAVGLRRREVGDVETRGVEAGHRVCAVRRPDGLAAGQAIAVAVGVGEDMLERGTIGHHGAFALDYVVAP